ncbi:unnamed protein product [Caenorhabditis brenneri]
MPSHTLYETLATYSGLYYIGKGILKDFEYGSSRNSVKRLLLFAMTLSGVDTGMKPGENLIGGVLVGIGAYFAFDVAFEVVFDAISYNMYSEHCTKCSRTFYIRRYQVHHVASMFEKCPECLEKSK